MKNSITGIAIKVNQVFSANKIVRSASKVTNISVYLKSWINKYGYIYHDIQMIRTIMYLTMILVISISCFNIVSTLVMATKEKTRDIAMLHTLGATNSLIQSIFIWYGILNGLVGILSGIMIGIIILVKITNIIKIIENFFLLFIFIRKYLFY